MSESQDWQIFTGREQGAKDDAVARLQRIAPPPWRTFGDPQAQGQRQIFVANDTIIRTVNAALYLRRPLLVTGKPGSGKSALARAIAQELDLEPLVWPITTRSTLQDGQYRYDALSRLRDVQESAYNSHPEASYKPEGAKKDGPSPSDVSRYIRLGPLGTAFASRDKPKVLLIEEIDKGDIDLPNDLLYIFETGTFLIPELRPSRFTAGAGAQDQDKIIRCEVETHNGGMVEIKDGKVQVEASVFPIIVLTSNGERAFPPAFLRRCIQLKMAPPTPEQLAQIIQEHLGKVDYERAEKLIKGYIENFVKKRREANYDIATDQLLNLVYLMTRNLQFDEDTRAELERELTEKLSGD